MTAGLDLGTAVDGRRYVMPIDAATSTFGILAKKGAGKSNTAVVMAEEMWAAGVSFVPAN